MFEEQKEKYAFKVSSVLEAKHSQPRLRALFIVGLLGNGLCWIAALFAPETVAKWVGLAADISGGFSKLLALVPLGFAFTMTYSICRLWPHKSAIDGIEGGAFMSRFRDGQQNERMRNIILISGAAGGLNVILFTLAVIWFGDVF